MKKLIFLLSIIFAPVLQAHFFAYQEWYNPKTGQILEEYYDVHRTDNAIINPTAHRHAVVARALQSDALVITEDKPSLHFGGINYKDSSEANKKTIQKFMREYPLDCSLSWSQAECFINDIETCNAECRELDTSKPHKACYEQELMSYNDGSVLNAFYKNLKQLAQDLDGLNQRDSSFNHKCFVVDARALHALHTSKKGVIMLTMGATHIVRINRILLQLGWQPRSIIAPTTFNKAQEETLTQALTPNAECLHTTLETWSIYLNNHVDSITNHEINLAEIALSQPTQAPINTQGPLAYLQKYIAIIKDMVTKFLQKK